MLSQFLFLYNRTDHGREIGLKEQEGHNYYYHLKSMNTKRGDRKDVKFKFWNNTPDGTHAAGDPPIKKQKLTSQQQQWTLLLV